MKIVYTTKGQISDLNQTPAEIPFDHLFLEQSNNEAIIYFKKLQSYLKNSKPEEVLLIINTPNLYVHESKKKILKKWEDLNTSVLFGAAASFDFSDEKLFYYYWKFYPRQDSVYDYLDSRFFVGKASMLLRVVNDITSNYTLSEACSVNDVFHRFFVDTQSQHIKIDYSIALDYKHELLGSSKGRMTTIKWPMFSKIHSLLFFESEQKLLSKNALAKYQSLSRDYIVYDTHPFNEKTKSAPSFYIEHIEKRNISFFALLLSGLAYIKSIWIMFVIGIFNKGNFEQEKIFRYTRNKGKEVNTSISYLTELLCKREPFSFSHFNDGEITFIEKYLENDHKEVWFGRYQNQYNEKLGKLLVDAFLLKRENYFVGAPCRICHPDLRSKVDELRTPGEFTIPAMTLHHNLNYYPSILGLIKNRKNYFVVNQYQDLTFFKKIGFHIEEEQIITIPFKKAHDEFDKLKDLKFEKGSVVLMMCGMLAKILCFHLFQSQPEVTFMAFGSSFDDLIQTDTNFKLYPKKYPFARHIKSSKRYLFGAKSECENCFNI